MINLWSCRTVYSTGQIIIYRNGIPLFAVTRDMRDGEPELSVEQRNSAAIQLCAAANRPALDDAQRAVLFEIARWVQHGAHHKPSAGVRSSAVRILNSLIDNAVAPPIQTAQESGDDPHGTIVVTDETTECGNCKFFRDGDCHRFPPSLVLDNAIGWPIALSTEWCGEYQRNAND